MHIVSCCFLFPFLYKRLPAVSLPRKSVLSYIIIFTYKYFCFLFIDKSCNLTILTLIYIFNVHLVVSLFCTSIWMNKIFSPVVINLSVMVECEKPKFSFSIYACTYSFFLLAMWFMLTAIAPCFNRRTVSNLLLLFVFRCHNSSDRCTNESAKAHEATHLQCIVCRAEQPVSLDRVLQ